MDKSNVANDEITAFFQNTEQVTRVLQSSIKKALLKHKQAGNPACEWQQGKVVWIPADKIPVEDNHQLK